MIGKLTLFCATLWRDMIAHPTDCARRARVGRATLGATVVAVIVVIVASVVVIVTSVVVIIPLLVRMFGIY